MTSSRILVPLSRGGPATIAGDVDLLLEIRRALCECKGERIVEGSLEAVAVSIHSFIQPPDLTRKPIPGRRICPTAPAGPLAARPLHPPSRGDRRKRLPLAPASPRGRVLVARQGGVAAPSELALPPALPPVCSRSLAPRLRAQSRGHLRCRRSEMLLFPDGHAVLLDNAPCCARACPPPRACARISNA